MSGKSKLAKQKKAAGYIAKIMYDSLQQFPEEDLEERIQRIERIKVRGTHHEKPSKRSSTARSLRERRLRATR